MTRSILITGCSSGIGHHCAHALHARGWNVLATCRKPEDAERLRAEGLSCGVLDLSDADSITAGLSWALDQTGGTLDALFNNGAFGLPGAVEDLPTDGLREIFETNFFGWHDLTRQVIPVMRAQGHGRIVQNSSVLGFITYKWRAAYVSTKFALEGLTDTMRLELKDSGIHVVLIEPGPVTSKIRENARSHFERWIDWENSALSDLYRDTLLKRLYEDKDKPDAFELPPEAVAKKLIHALESGRPRPRYYVTVPTYFMGAMKRLLPTRALDWLIDKG
ncbi:SDR family oxidoreductase [Nioella sp.]|uniref:SDR family oxidoreductase n=1 Tax=Nioella sp. TaxID=1912091 RepID=UPI003B527D25